MNAAGTEVIGAWIGGSYSPPTWAHIDLAESVGDFLSHRYPGRKIQVFFVPANDKYQSSDGKDSISVNCISEEHRLRMLEIAASLIRVPNVEFLVSDHEYRYGKGEYDDGVPKAVGKGGMNTYISVAKLKEITGIRNMYLVQGQDNVESILRGSWSNTEGLLNEMTILCIPREKGELTTESLIKKVKDSGRSKLTEPLWKLAEKIAILPFLDNGRDHTLISSTKVRKAFREGKFNGLENMTSPKIIKYVFENKLYGFNSRCEDRKKEGRYNLQPLLTGKGGKRTRRRRSRRMQRKKRRTLKSRKV